MTTERRDGQESPFSAWVRSHPELDSRGNKLSITDSDMWVHRFSERNGKKRQASNDVRDLVESIMMIEIKTHLKDVPFAQKDTLSVIDAFIRSNTIVNGRRRHSSLIVNGRRRTARVFGIYLLVMSGDRPDNSEIIRWNNSCNISEQYLIQLLRFERDPDAPHKELDTRLHHTMRKPRVIDLFGRDESMMIGCERGG